MKEAVGFNEDREDTIVVTSGDFIQEMDVITKNGLKILVPKYDWAIIYSSNFSNCNFWCIEATVLNRILVPSAGAAGTGGATESDLEAEEAEEEVQVQEGESLEDIKAKLKPKKSTISADMLDTANTMMIK